MSVTWIWLAGLVSDASKDTPRDTHEEQQTSQTHDLKGLIEIVQNAPDGQSLDDLTSAVAVKLDEIFAGKMVSRKEEGAKQQQVRLPDFRLHLASPNMNFRNKQILSIAHHQTGH